MNLEELKKKSPAELISQAEKLSIENSSTLRKQEILFAILNKFPEVEYSKFYKMGLVFYALLNQTICQVQMIFTLAQAK